MRQHKIKIELHITSWEVTHLMLFFYEGTSIYSQQTQLSPQHASVTSLQRKGIWTLPQMDWKSWTSKSVNQNNPKSVKIFSGSHKGTPKQSQHILVRQIFTLDQNGALKNVNMGQEVPLIFILRLVVTVPFPHWLGSEVTRFFWLTSWKQIRANEMRVNWKRSVTKVSLCKKYSTWLRRDQNICIKLFPGGRYKKIEFFVINTSFTIFHIKDWYLTFLKLHSYTGRALLALNTPSC